MRSLAVVVAVAVLSMSGSAAWMHVHASTGHGPAAHHHSPAAHGHAPVPHRHHHQHDAGTRGDGTAIGSSDPASHVVPLVFACVAVEPLEAPLPGMFDTGLLPTPGTSAVTVAPSDVRAHSPPRITDAPLRAPPPTHLA